MRTSLTFLGRRGIRLSSLVLAGATLLAACDIDRPTKPIAEAKLVAANLATRR